MGKSGFEDEHGVPWESCLLAWLGEGRAAVRIGAASPGGGGARL